MYYLSAYAIAVAHGFRGSEEQWLESLKGKPGKSAYEVAVECGFVGTKEEWLETLKGEADLPVAHAAAAAQNDHYAAVGENLPDIHKADGELPAVGVGKQLIFLPQRANLTEAPLLTLNSGEQIEVRLRADGETADTVPVPVGALKAGVPVTLTFGGTYWLVDSAIGGLGGGNAERVELTQPVTIGETECGNVQDALEAAADALEDKIDEKDVEKVPFVTASDALQQVANDTAPITPAGVKRIVDKYGGDAQNIIVYDLDSVSTAELYALTEEPKCAVFLAYNVANYTPDPEAETVVYPYENKLLLLPMTGCKLSPLGNYLQATFEQDADLITYTAETPPVAVTVRKTVRVTVQSGATAGDPDVKTVEIEDAELPPITLSSGNNQLTGSERAYNSSHHYTTNDKCYYPANSNGTRIYKALADGAESYTPGASGSSAYWEDLGVAFEVSGDINFLKYEKLFAAGKGVAKYIPQYFHQGSWQSGVVIFGLSTDNGFAKFRINYNTSTGIVASIRYTATPYATT